jgi:hypothetical protein
MKTATIDPINVTTRSSQISRLPCFPSGLPKVTVVAEIIELQTWRAIETATTPRDQPLAKTEAMATETSSIVPLDMAAYLKEEAERRGSDIATVYQEEIAAKEELVRITPRNADLLRIAESSLIPQEWYDE